MEMAFTLEEQGTFKKDTTAYAQARYSAYVSMFLSLSLDKSDTRAAEAMHRDLPHCH